MQNTRHPRVDPERQQRKARLEKLIRTAALTIDSKGSIAVLAIKAGVSPETLRKAIRNGKFSVGLASTLELSLGRNLLKREDLCPDRFTQGASHEID